MLQFGNHYIVFLFNMSWISTNKLGRDYGKSSAYEMLYNPKRNLGRHQLFVNAYSYKTLVGNSQWQVQLAVILIWSCTCIIRFEFNWIYFSYIYLYKYLKLVNLVQQYM